MVWAGDRNYYTTGETAYPEDHTELETKEAVAYNRCSESCWHSGGTWLMAVFPVEGRSTLVGFVHGEDHFRDMDNSSWCAWKSIAVCYSEDQGMTWTKPNLIITSPCQRPEKPEFGGSSDFCVVKRSSEYYCFFCGTDKGGMCGVRIARSTDPLGQPGSWSKWWEGSFSQPGLGGREGEVKDLQVWGGNPSVTWNEYLQRWLMVWHGWEPPHILLSSSRDLLHWEPAVRIVTEEGRITRYPTIISGNGGDKSCFQAARLYYGSMTSNGFQDRKFIGRDISFFRKGDPENYIPSQYSDPNYKPLSISQHLQAPPEQPSSCPQHSVDHHECRQMVL